MSTKHSYYDYHPNYRKDSDRRRPTSDIRRKRIKHRRNRFLHFIFPMLCLILLLAACASFILEHSLNTGTSFLKSSFFGGNPSNQVRSYAERNGLSLSDYPQNLIDLYERNPETKDFVFEYPLKKNASPSIDLGGLSTSSVPLLMQWDQRWGYEEYAGDLFGLTGCGPTCLSMAAIYLTGDTSMNPKWMADFATSYGYASEGNGSAWTLFSEGARKLGLDVTEIPMDEQRIADNLNVGNPIVASMGKGDFTTSGHFIVLTAYKDGQLKVNDPNSKENSEKLWDYDQISGQIRNLWVLRN